MSLEEIMQRAEDRATYLKLVQATVRCPYCSAYPGEKCSTAGGEEAWYMHSTRETEYENR